MTGRLVLACAALCWTSACAAPSPCSLQQLAIEAALGDPEAQYNLAVEFFRGESLPRDLAKAAALWRLSAEGGDPDAASNLGYLLFFGQGVERNPEEAIRLWRRAAAAGQSEAHLHLSRAYAAGASLEQDTSEAYAHALAALLLARGERDEAAQAVSRDASAQLDLVRPRLTPTQVESAEQRGRDYVESALTKRAQEQ